ncbi:hypothetical protein FB451DRAFT_412416 [Mycena latifolia]|nr:hypothetical protein FB451DRAFT_412416 [Mycena latifolia]
MRLCEKRRRAHCSRSLCPARGYGSETLTFIFYQLPHRPTFAHRSPLPGAPSSPAHKPDLHPVAPGTLQRLSRRQRGPFVVHIPTKDASGERGADSVMSLVHDDSGKLIVQFEGARSPEAEEDDGGLLPRSRYWQMMDEQDGLGMYERETRDDRGDAVRARAERVGRGGAESLGRRAGHGAGWRRTGARGRRRSVRGPGSSSSTTPPCSSSGGARRNSTRRSRRRT